MSLPLHWYLRPRLASDAESFADYNLYLVASSTTTGAGLDSKVWFTRSTDGAESWEEPYVMAEIPSEGHLYWEPDVA
jgi:hypothetical protein